MSPNLIGVLLAVALAAVVLIIIGQLRTRSLRKKFGPEYDQTLKSMKGRGKAEADRALFRDLLVVDASTPETARPTTRDRVLADSPEPSDDSERIIPDRPQRSIVGDRIISDDGAARPDAR